MLSIPNNAGTLSTLKSYLTKAMPEVKSSHRIEACARGLGYRTYAAMRAASRLKASESCTPNHQKFTAYLADHGFEVAGYHLYNAVGYAAMRAVFESHPRLTHTGNGPYRWARNPDGTRMNWAQRDAYFRKQREDYLTFGDIEKFLLASAFVALLRPIKTNNRRSSSYYLKHLAEEYACKYPDGTELGPRYVTNGTLIAAAIHAGFKHKVFYDEYGNEELNVTFNMARSSIEDAACFIRPDGTEAELKAMRGKPRQRSWPQARAVIIDEGMIP